MTVGEIIDILEQFPRDQIMEMGIVTKITKEDPQWITCLPIADILVSEKHLIIVDPDSSDLVQEIIGSKLMCAGRANPTKEGQRKRRPLLCQMTPPPRPWKRLAIPMPRGLRRAVHLLHHPIDLLDPTPCPRLHLMLPPLRWRLCLYSVGRPEDSPAGWVLAYSAYNGGNCFCI